MSHIYIRNLTRECPPIEAEYANTFFSRLRGLMFRHHIDIQQGLLLVEPVEGRWNTAIHMLWMRFEIAVIWINNQHQIVDLCLAHPWVLAYIPAQPARYTLEIHPSRLKDYQKGDRLDFELF